MELQDYFNVVVRRKWLIIQVCVLVTAAAVVFSFLQPPTYEATATLLVREQGLVSSLFGNILPGLSGIPERGLQTQVDLIRLRPVAEKVIKRLDLNLTPEGLSAKTSVEINPRSNLMTISVSDRSPRVARMLANSIAEQYAVWNKALNSEEINRARDEIYTKLKETEKNIVSIAKKVAAAGGTNAIPEDLRTQWTMATTLYGMLAEKYEQLRIVSASSGGDSTLVAPAVLPKRPVYPKRVRNVILGLLLGLTLGAGLGFLLEYMDTTIMSRADVEKHLQLPVLGEIPSPVGGKNGWLEVVSLTKPRSVQAEAFRMLRAKVYFLTAAHSSRCMVVSRLDQGDRNGGTGVVAANLGVAFARGGRRARVVCCNFRRPDMHDLFELDSGLGVTNVVLDAVPLSEVIQIEPKTELEIVASGPKPEDPDVVLGSKAMARLIEQSREEADVVIIDAPAMIATSDILQLAPHSDGVIIVAECGLTTTEEGRRAKEALEEAGVKVLGVVLTEVVPSQRDGEYDRYSDQEVVEELEARSEAASPVK